MCFSAEADFTAAAVIAVPAADALRHVRYRREIPIAAIPALLVAHSLIGPGRDEMLPAHFSHVNKS